MKAFLPATGYWLLATSGHDLWRFLPLGYLFTVAVETPVLVLLLSGHHTLRRRLLAGLWLTACTYPVVVLVLPLLFADSSRALYLAFGGRGGGGATRRDLAAIVAANLLSFLGGEVLNAWGWFGLFR